MDTITFSYIKVVQIYITEILSNTKTICGLDESCPEG